jgi:hypothetical protein
LRYLGQPHSLGFHYSSKIPLSPADTPRDYVLCKLNFDCQKGGEGRRCLKLKIKKYYRQRGHPAGGVYCGVESVKEMTNEEFRFSNEPLDQHDCL